MALAMTARTDSPRPAFLEKTKAMPAWQLAKSIAPAAMHGQEVALHMNV
jgi:hypothetical protein